jgi:dephospho-CoA kinase
MPWVVGLTGGIGSGKSAAAEAFAARGATVVDTDSIAHALTRPCGAAIPLIREAFGDEAIGADGAMDRRRVRELVFQDAAAKARLESILHPMIRAESERQVRAAPGPYAMLVVPLLVESGTYRERVDRVLVVDCSEEAQVARVGQRSGLAPDEVRRIIAAQVPRAERLAAADDVIDNSGSLDALQQAVSRLHEQYLRYAAVGGRRARS